MERDSLRTLAINLKGKGACEMLEFLVAPSFHAISPAR
jgi:hypothetical protein